LWPDGLRLALGKSAREMFEILYAPDVTEDLKNLSAFRRKEIIDKIEEQLAHEPDHATRNKKFIKGIKPPWTEKKGFWELRIGEYRAFYDVDSNNMQVIVQAIRRKPPHKTTEDIL
jgi:mRNA-degrading endonuclease RelE of RelBE toxin-antitoxin system